MITPNAEITAHLNQIYSGIEKLTHAVSELVKTNAKSEERHEQNKTTFERFGRQLEIMDIEIKTLKGEIMDIELKLAEQKPIFSTLTIVGGAIVTAIAIAIISLVVK